jgi:hypothetical protein
MNLLGGGWRMSLIEIHHPGKCQHDHKANDRNPEFQVPRVFVAFGQYNRAQAAQIATFDLTGFLTDDDDMTTTVDPVGVILDPNSGTWAMFFGDNQNPVAPGFYFLTVQVRDQDATQVVSGRFEVLGGYGGIITYPADGSTVCPSFTAYGTTQTTTGNPGAVYTGSIGYSQTSLTTGKSWSTNLSGLSGSGTLTITVAPGPNDPHGTASESSSVSIRIWSKCTPVGP